MAFAKAAAYAVVRWHCPYVAPLTLGVEHISRKMNSIPATVGNWCGSRCGRGDSITDPATSCRAVPVNLSAHTLGLLACLVMPGGDPAWLHALLRGEADATAQNGRSIR